MTATSERSARIWLAAIFVAAAWLRLQGLDWDDGQHLHPDERFLTMVENAISLPRSFAEYLDTGRSPLNPGNHNYKFFVYGTLPLFAVRVIGEWLGKTDYATVHLVGRVMSALCDLGTVGLTYLLGLKLCGRRAGLAAAALVAFSVTSIQNAHFFTVDSPAAFFATAALFALVVFADEGSIGAALCFGAAFGAMLCCRINLAVLGGVYPLALLSAHRSGAASVRRLAVASLAAGFVAALAVRTLQPYAFAGPGFFGIRPAADFLRSMREIRDFATGAADFPPAIQWIGRTPFLFAAKNLFLWGIGPGWGVGAVVGAVWWFARERSLRSSVAVGWGGLLFAYHAPQFTATGRYFLPMIPVLAIVAAWPFGVSRRRAVTVFTTGIVVLTALWAFAFTAIYRRPLTRVEASRWIYRNVPAGATITAEHWDDALPLGLRDVPRVPYRTVELHLFDEDGVAKRRELVARLDEADYVVVSSNRLYRSIPRAPWKYPMARRYYELLFAGDLGFRLEQSFTSYPRIGSFEIPDDEAEEAFTVYDHPHVLIFKKTESYSHEKVEELLSAAPLTGIRRVSPRDGSRLYRELAPSDIPLPEQAGVRTAVEATQEGSLGALACWLAALEVLSIAAFLVLFAPLSGMPDRGYGLAKIVAWLAPGYLTWLLCSTGLAFNTSATARSAALAVVAAGAWRGWRRRAEVGRFLREARREIVVVELVFLASLAVFLAARAVDPAIFWGEKPMDFAYLNAIVRSRTMPPADPWFAGGTLNYFYFGHALAAFFSELSGVAPRFGFNLAIGTIGALLAVASHLVGRRLSGSLLGGLAAALAVTFLGNVDGARLYLGALHRPFDFNYAWATSRVVADTINEYPVWSLFFADLHAHVLAMPFEVALLYLGLAWWRSPEGGPAPSRIAVGILTAWFLGVVGTTSAWSMPTTVLLQLAFLVTAWRSEPRARWRSLALVVAGWAVVAIASRGLFWPFWAHYTGPTGRGLGLESNRAPLLDVLSIFAIFLVALLPVAERAIAAESRGRKWLLLLAMTIVAGAAAWRGATASLFAAVALAGVATWLREESFERRSLGMLIAAAGGLGAATEVVYFWDRMNTVFKYYLEMWLLLGCAAGAAVPGLWRESRRVVWRGGLVVLVVAGVFTAATAGYGLHRSPFMPSDVPTLDGMDYLRRARPAELAAYQWLAREVEGVPVMLEAQGDPYGAFARVSMNTGLPTVLGWEYHLFQQAHSQSELRERRADVELLYSTTDPAIGAALMRKYHVDLVVVGALERKTYPAAGLAKFGEWPLTRPAFESGGVTVYATPGLVHSTKTWVEPVVSTTAEGAAPLGVYSEPRDLARGPDGSVWIADFGNKRIQHASATLVPLGTFGRLGDAPGQFRDPCGIAVGPDGNVYVADTWNHRIQKLSPTGAALDEWSPGLYGPRGIALDRAGRIYVTDTGNHRVLRLSPAGEVELEWGKKESPLDNPVGIAVSDRGEVYVADAQHKRIVVYDEDGKRLREWPVAGWLPTAYAEPYIEVGPDGVVWVTDPSGDRVLLYDSEGRPLGSAAHDVPLQMPLGIAVLDANRAVVANARSHSLAPVWRTSSTSVAPEAER